MINIKTYNLRNCCTKCTNQTPFDYFLFLFFYIPETGINHIFLLTINTFTHIKTTARRRTAWKKTCAILSNRETLLEMELKIQHLTLIRNAGSNHYKTKEHASLWLKLVTKIRWIVVDFEWRPLRAFGLLVSLSVEPIKKTDVGHNSKTPSITYVYYIVRTSTGTTRAVVRLEGSHSKFFKTLVSPISYQKRLRSRKYLIEFYCITESVLMWFRNGTIRERDIFIWQQKFDELIPII